MSTKARVAVLVVANTTRRAGVMFPGTGVRITPAARSLPYLTKEMLSGLALVATSLFGPPH